MPKRLNPAVEVRQLRQQLAEALAYAERLKGFTLQQCLDIAQITLNDPQFGFGPERNRRFGEAYIANFTQLAVAAIEDADADEDIVYTKSVMDRLLAQACGPDILPFDERYSSDRLYYRGRDLPGEKGS